MKKMMRHNKFLWPQLTPLKDCRPRTHMLVGLPRHTKLILQPQLAPGDFVEVSMGVRLVGLPRHTILILQPQLAPGDFVEVSMGVRLVRAMVATNIIGTTTTRFVVFVSLLDMKLDSTANWHDF